MECGDGKHFLTKSESDERRLDHRRRLGDVQIMQHRMDSQLAGKVLLSNHFGQKLEVARFLLAIEHLESGTFSTKI